jgi:hypothetical protein
MRLGHLVSILNCNIDLFAELDLWNATVTPLYATKKVKIPEIKAETNTTRRSGTSETIP